MRNPPFWMPSLLLGSLMVAGCFGGGSSSGNGDPSDDGSPPDSGETPIAGDAPEDTVRFGRALLLEYTSRYDGSTDWASIEAAYDGSPEDQPQRVAVDVDMLGSALASALHYMDEQVLDAGGGDDTIYGDAFHQSLGFQECQAPGNTSVDANGITFDNSCIVVTALDDREIVLTGEVTWQDDPSLPWSVPGDQPTRLVEFENLDVDWNGQSFVMNGALADEPSMFNDPDDPDARPGGLLHMAWDATHQGTNRTFRFARRFQNTLVNPGAADDLAYHPDLGAIANLLSESWLAGDTCDDGGVDDVALGLYSDTLDDNLQVGLAGCDAYFFVPESASANLDSGGDQIRPELYRLLASIGMENGSHSEWTLDPDQDDHYELAAQDGLTYLEPEAVEIGRIGGISVNGVDDTAYQITLSFDPDDIAVSGLTPGQVVAGVLRFHVASRGADGGHAQFYGGGVTEEEWSGELAKGEIWVDGAGDISLVGHPDQPWHAAIVTPVVETTVDHGRPRVQMVVSTLATPGQLMQDGDYTSGICLRDEGGECAEELLPSLMVITED